MHTNSAPACANGRHRPWQAVTASADSDITAVTTARPARCGTGRAGACARVRTSSWALTGDSDRRQRDSPARHACRGFSLSTRMVWPAPWSRRRDWSALASRSPRPPSRTHPRTPAPRQILAHRANDNVHWHCHHPTNTRSPGSLRFPAHHLSLKKRAQTPTLSHQ